MRDILLLALAVIAVIKIVKKKWLMAAFCVFLVLLGWVCTFQWTKNKSQSGKISAEADRRTSCQCPQAMRKLLLHRHLSSRLRFYFFSGGDARYSSQNFKLFSSSIPFSHSAHALWYFRITRAQTLRSFPITRKVSRKLLVRRYPLSLFSLRYTTCLYPK